MCWLAECHTAIQWGNNLRVDLFKSKNLGYLVLLATMVTLVVGLMLFLIDPNIDSPFDGIWSAWVTMTHVGFGDVVPISFLGRFLAAGLILFGLVFFSLFTALVSVSLIGRNMDALGVWTCGISNWKLATFKLEKTGFSLSWLDCMNAWRRWRNSCHRPEDSLIEGT